MLTGCYGTDEGPPSLPVECFNHCLDQGLITIVNTMCPALLLCRRVQLATLSRHCHLISISEQLFGISVFGHAQDESETATLLPVNHVGSRPSRHT